MPSNIEIKAVLSNRAAAEAVAARLSGAPPQTLQQEDFFFHCDGARLKLRVLRPDHGELIRYERDDIADARRSRYFIARSKRHEVLLQVNPDLGKPEHHEARWVDFPTALAMVSPISRNSRMWS